MGEEKKPEAEELYIDLSNIPLMPTSKKDIQKLETALIIATLYSPEVIELIKDPVERATWVDSLAVAAAALARQKAGYPVSQIAEEVGRSETMIRAHLSGKTKAGRLVLRTYEKMLRGELKVKLPFREIGVPVATKPEVEEEVRRLEELKKKLEEENNELKKKVEELEEKLHSLEQELSRTRSELEKKTKIIEEIKRIISES